MIGFTLIGVWEQCKAEELCKISTGKGNTQDKVENGKYPFYVRSENIERSNYFLYDQEAVQEEFFIMCLGNTICINVYTECMILINKFRQNIFITIFL